MRIAFCGVPPKYELARALRDRWPDLQEPPALIEQYPPAGLLRRFLGAPYRLAVEHQRCQAHLPHYIAPTSLYDLFVTRPTGLAPTFRWWMGVFEHWHYDALFYLPAHAPPGCMNDTDDELRAWLRALHVPYNTLSGDFEEQLSQVACVLGLRLRPALKEEPDANERPPILADFDR